MIEFNIKQGFVGKPRCLYDESEDLVWFEAEEAEITDAVLMGERIIGYRGDQYVSIETMRRNPHLTDKILDDINKTILSLGRAVVSAQG